MRGKFPARGLPAREAWGDGKSSPAVAALLLLLLSASDSLGPPLRHEGFTMRPPANFRMARMDLFHGTRVGGVTPGGGTRYLSAALMDGDGEDAASLLLFVADATLTLGPSSRDTLSTQVVRHFNDELKQPFSMERAEIVDGRVQVLGSIREGSQLRRVLVAAWPGEGRHVVATASVPSGRWDALSPKLAESFATLRVEPPVSGQPPQRYVWAFLAMIAAMFFISVGLWRRRQSLRGDLDGR